MNKTRVWSLGAVAVAVVLILAAWFALIAPQRSQAATLRVQTTEQEAKNASIKLKTKQLRAQFASLPEREAQLAEIRQQLPSDPALPSLIRDLSTKAEAAGVTLESVAPAEPTALAAGPGAVPAAPAAAGAAVPASPIQAIQTKLTLTGSYAELTLYLQKVQSTMRRAYLVENVTLTAQNKDAKASADSSDLTMTVDGKVFILSADAPAAPVTPVTPTTPAK